MAVAARIGQFRFSKNKDFPMRVFVRAPDWVSQMLKYTVAVLLAFEFFTTRAGPAGLIYCQNGAWVSAVMT